MAEAEPENKQVPNKIRKTSPEKRLQVFWDKHPRVSFGLVTAGFSVGVWGSLCPFRPGVAVVALAVMAAVMSLRPQMRTPEKAAWLVVMGCLAFAEIRAITKSSNDNESKMQGVVNGINTEIDLSKQTLAISQSLLASVELLSRPSNASSDKPQTSLPLIKAWGAISQLKSKSVEVAVATPKAPALIQSENVLYRRKL